MVRIFIFLLICVNSVDAQYYTINKQKTKDNILAVDTFSPADRNMIVMGIELMEIILFMDEDSVYVASGKSYTTIAAESKDEFMEVTNYSKDGFEYDKVWFDLNTDESVVESFAEMQSNFEQRLAEEKFEKYILDSVFVFETLEIDFGSVEVGEKLKGVFYFENNGKDSLKLLEVKSSCGCTVPVWPAHAIAAGVRDSISFVYDTTDKPSGNSTRRITVKHNLSEHPITLKVKGDINNPNKEEVDLDKMLNPFRGEEITLEELEAKKKEYEEMQNNLKRLQEFFGEDERIKEYKFHEMYIVDTLDNDKFYFSLNIEKYLEMTESLKKE